MARLLSLQNKCGNPPLIAKIVFPFIFLSALLLIDHSIPGSSILGSCLAISLFALTLIQPASWFAYSAVIFSAAFIGGLFNPTLFEFLNNRPLELPVPVAFYTRSGAFIMLSGFCVMTNIVLQRFRSAHCEMLEIITRFTKPLIVCDLSGGILFSNLAAKERFRLHAHDPQPSTVVELFAREGDTGEFISSYISSFTHFGIISTGDQSGSITLYFDGKELRGEILPLRSSGGSNIILTVYD